MIFIDTNYFLRFLLKDVESQHLQVKNLFLEAAEDKKKLFTSLIVFFELYWVLTSYYQQDKDQLINTLNQLLGFGFVHISEKTILNESLHLFNRSSLSLEDCYNLSFAKSSGAKDFKTFDKKLSKHFS